MRIKNDIRKMNILRGQRANSETMDVDVIDVVELRRFVYQGMFFSADH